MRELPDLRQVAAKSQEESLLMGMPVPLAACLKHQLQHLRSNARIENTSEIPYHVPTSYCGMSSALECVPG